MRSFAIAWLLCLLLILSLSRLPSTPVCLAAIVLTLLMGFLFRTLRPVVAGILMALSVTGFSLYSFSSHQLLAHQVSTDLNLTVLINSIPERQGRRLSFVGKVTSCHSCSSELAVKQLRLSWYGRSPELRAGESWQMSVRLKPPESLRNPGGFDALAWSLVKGFHAKGYVRDGMQARRVQAASNTSIVSIRQRFVQKMQQLSAQSSSGADNYLGLVQALTVGLKSDITEEQWTLLRATGTAHLLAISGLHVGLVAAWVLFLGALLLRARRKVALITEREKPVADWRTPLLLCSLMSALLYALLAGFELPTQRAVLMLGVWVLAAIRFRFLPPMAALCVALAVVLSTNVLNPLSAGFWLSFGTVATLFYLHRGHVDKPAEQTDSSWKNRLLRLRHSARTHCLLGVVLLPVSAWFFQTGSLLSPLANFIAVPWVAMVSVPLVLLTLVASLISDAIAQPLFALCTTSLHWLLRFLELLHATRLSSMVLVVPGIMAFALSLGGLLILFGPRGTRLHAFAWPLFLPVLLFNDGRTGQDRFEVHFLDVGQGLAALVFAGEHTLLFDTGGKISPSLSMFEAVVVPFLHASGRRHIDTLVISHGDEDHAFGVSDVLSRYPDIHVYSSQKLAIQSQPEFSDIPVQWCSAGIQWRVAHVSFSFLHPDPSSSGSDNNRSCVLLAFSGKSRVLLTGDIELPSEERLVAKLGKALFPVTVLSAPHHGSNTSSSQLFIDKFRPEYVVFAAGERNRYGFPHSDVQLRYKLAGADAFVTGRDGAVSFVLGSKGLTSPPQSWWHSHRRFWHGIVNPDCWQKFASQSLVLRLLELSQKGQKLCGK